jgi:hypothetical protein
LLYNYVYVYVYVYVYCIPLIHTRSNDPWDIETVIIKTNTNTTDTEKIQYNFSLSGKIPACRILLHKYVKGDKVYGALDFIIFIDISS